MGASRRPDEHVPGPDRDDEPEPDPYSVTRAICLKLLTQRARTRVELAQALRKRNVSDEVAASVLDRFSELGLINDVAFAETYAASRRSDRGLSARAIASELRQRGVADATVRDAIAGMDPAAEEQDARSFVERRLRTMTNLAPEVQTRRLVGQLARRGYSAGLAYRVVRDALAARGRAVDARGSSEIDDSPD